MVTVHMLRGGAPDKVALHHDLQIQLIKRDHCNLVDMSDQEIMGMIDNKEFIVPADEMDILRANELWDNSLTDQSNILLPQTGDPGGHGCKVIKYDEFVPKNSYVYQHLREETGIIYPQYKEWTVDEFQSRVTEIIAEGTDYKGAIKGTVGSGSRTVWLINDQALKYGGKYYDKLTPILADEIFRSVNDDYKIIEQELIPFEQNNLKKVNVDFIIRNCNLLGYKWDVVDQNSLFTNWDQGIFVDNHYIKHLMESLCDYLTHRCGVINAIMNFEAFSNMVDETWLVEFNWRYSNSMFEWSSVGIDPIFCYLMRLRCDIPSYALNREFKRYWKCDFTDKLLGKN